MVQVQHPMLEEKFLFQVPLRKNDYACQVRPDQVSNQPEHLIPMMLKLTELHASL